MSGYDSWLESGAHDHEDEEIYIENRVPELMDEEDFDPSSIAHLSEAISEASEADQDIIRDYINTGDWYKLGLKLYNISFEYMEKYATDQAQREYSEDL